MWHSNTRRSFGIDPVSSSERKAVVSTKSKLYASASYNPCLLTDYTCHSMFFPQFCHWELLWTWVQSHITGGAITNQVLVEIQLDGAHHTGIFHAIVVQPAHLPSGYKYPVIKPWHVHCVSTAPSVFGMNLLCLLCSGQSHHGSNGEVHFH